ncbi:anthranilate synthase component I family protein [Paenibacillus cellulositrophicus]|uniref:anthranilate synthase component I family protein n=1 Tax=Paenibacillus cellulositrophicus TaxID=562959 RepID=UPI003D961AA7
MKRNERGLITLDQWMTWAADGITMFPYVLSSGGWDRQEEGELPAAWTSAWEQASPYSFVLESGKEGRYTYLGLRPVSVLHGKDHGGVVTHLLSGATEKVDGSPLQVLQRWMAPYRAPQQPDPELPPLLGGCVGFLGYDIVRSLENLPSTAADLPAFPDYLWMRMEELWVHDADSRKVYCTVHVHFDAEGLDRDLIGQRLGVLYEEAAERARSMQSLWLSMVNLDGGIQAEADRRRKQAEELSPRMEWPQLRTGFPQESFEQAVRAIQQYIREGDVFQVNLSLRQELDLHSPPEQAYEWLRLLNPSPYMGLLRSPGFTLVSGSPELLVKLQGERISTRPIAGTRRRGLTPQEDAAMAAELLGSEKERAEHIMLVDLERNDLGKVAAYGSVHVPELMTVEHYSHVMHLVSQVEGRLAPGKGVYDVIAAFFPGGTITGAPKVRTMEIIEELEPVRRGPYTGSIGWIDYNGNMELNIIIRTMAVLEGTGYIQAGAGIVIDSDPYREYRECQNKAKGMILAVLASEEESAAKSGIRG